MNCDEYAIYAGRYTSVDVHLAFLWALVMFSLKKLHSKADSTENCINLLTNL